jgi:hypothetical protein
MYHILNHYDYKFSLMSSILCFYIIKYDYVMEYQKSDNMTIFWYFLKNLDPTTLAIIEIPLKKPLLIIR